METLNTTQKKSNLLRGYKNVRILKNVDNPIMFMGFPLKLAFFYVGSIIVGFMVALILNAMQTSLWVNILIPVIIIAGGVIGVRMFFSKYGVNGFELSQRDKRLFPDINGQLSILDEIRLKLKEKEKNGKVR